MSQETFKSLFPEKEITIGENNRLIIRPIPIRYMDKVVGILLKLIQLVQSGTPPEQLPFVAIEDLIKLIPYSIVGNYSIDDIPGTTLPEVLQAMIELNLDGTVLKNWKALLQIIGEKLPKVIEQEITGKEVGPDSGK